MTVGMPPHTLALGASPAVEANPIRSVIERRQWTIVVIDKRTILRECLAQTILSWAAEVRMLSSVDEFSGTAAAAGCDVVILCGAGLPDIIDNLSALNREGGLCPVLLVCDNCTPETVVNALELGVRGVLPTSSSLGILNGVISLILSGGVYVPPDSMITAQKAGAAPAALPTAGQPFTPRQSAIISAIRKGRPNKIIAYELGMCESTVKVHIRNIMKKLKVRNRTELAFRASELNISP